jgi:hypothetical protein
MRTLPKIRTRSRDDAGTTVSIKQTRLAAPPGEDSSRKQQALEAKPYG